MFSVETEDRSRIYLAQPDSRTPVQPLDFIEGGTGFRFSHYGHPAWSLDGSALAFRVNGDVWMAWQEPGQEGGGDVGWDVTRLIAAASFDAPTYRASREIHVAGRIALSPDGKTIAYDVTRLGGSGTAELHIAEVEPTNEFMRYDEPQIRRRVLWAPAVEPCFSPDGRWLLMRQLPWEGDFDGLVALEVATGKVRNLVEGAARGSW